MVEILHRRCNISSIILVDNDSKALQIAFFALRASRWRQYELLAIWPSFFDVSINGWIMGTTLCILKPEKGRRIHGKAVYYCGGQIGADIGFGRGLGNLSPEEGPEARGVP